VLNTADYTADSPLKEGKLLLILQDIQYLGTTHNHDGGTGDGGTLPTADPKAIWFYSNPAGGAFA
jgi:hypothetical protein